MEIMGTGANATYSCGWLHIIGDGLLISLHNEVCHTQLDMLTVIRMTRLSITYLSLVLLHINSGSASSRGSACMFSHRSLKKHPLIIGGPANNAVVSQTWEGLSFPHHCRSMVALKTL